MKFKTGIRFKIVLYICLATFVVALAGLGSGYFFGYKLVRDTVGEDHVKMAENIAVSVSGLLERVIVNIDVRTTSLTHINAILERGLKYENKTPAEIKEYFLSMDKKWAEADADSPLVTEYMAGESAQRLKKYTLEDKTISEIFTTDRFGGLVAASGKTSDFYQADEEWWSAAYNDGKGAIYLGKIEYDESSGETALPVAAPVRGEKGEVIGVLKAVLNVGVLFGPLENFKIGKTGHAVLVDKKGFIIYHRGIKPLSAKLCGNEEFTGLVDNPKKWAILVDPHIHKKEMFAAFAVINHPLLSERGMIWRIFIDQEAREAFSILNRLFVQMWLVVVFIILVLLPTAFVFGGVFVKPIAKLRDAVEHIGKGEFDYPIEIKTGDEIEGVADSFRNMVENLKKSLISIENLSKEIAARKKAEGALSYFQKAVDSATDAIGMSTPEGRHYYQNEAFTKLFGLSVSEVNGASGPPGTVYADEKVGRKVFDIIMEGGFFEGEVKMLGKDRKEIDILQRAYSLKDKEGKIIGLVGMNTDITERKKTQADLELFKKTLESSTDAVGMSRPDGCHYYQNKAFDELFGKIGKNPVKDIYVDKKIGEEVFAAIMAGGQWAGELQMRARDNTIRDVLLRAYSVKDKNGAVTVLVGIHTDITKRKKAEEKARIFLKAVEDAYDSIVLTDMNGNVTYANGAAVKNFGYSHEEMLKLNVSQFAENSEDAVMVVEEIKKKAGWIGEITQVRKNRETFPSILTASFFADEKGNPIGMIGIFRDITEHKRAQDEIVKAKDYTDNIIKSMFDTLIVINPDGEIRSINKATAVLLGYKEEELVGKPFGTILAEEEEEEEEEIPSIGTRLKQLINEGFIKEYNTAYKTKSDERIPVSLSGAVMRDKDDKLIGIIFIGRDLRDRKKAEDALAVSHKRLIETQHELVQASKMAAMGQLAAGISHELNQPLTGIKGFAQAVLADLERESPFRNDLYKIVGQVDRMDTIIKNVRFFARKSDFDIVELDINQVISKSLMLLNQQLKTHNIRVIQEFCLDIPKMQGDPNQLQQAFINIISNARDAILGLARPEGGEIYIKTSLSQDKKYIETTFRDTGCGIPKANLQYIFSPFFTTKSPDKGMGLGLSITYRIIENHQGKIDFKSKEGEGTTFSIAFPLEGVKDATTRS